MKKKIIIIIFLISMSISVIALGFFKNHTAVFESYSNTGVKGVITKEINNLLVEKLNEENNYDLYIKIVRKGNDEIEYVTIDSVKLNILANELSESIHNSIDNKSNQFGVPLGNTIGIQLLSGRGPKISFNINRVGSVGYEIRSELQSSGINQSLHRVCIDFKTEINCVAPFYSENLLINNTIVISEILIIGNIPEVMYSPVRS